jgi:hypothetical protein
MFINRNYVYWVKVAQQLTLSGWYSQLVANCCCRLACSLLKTPFITQDVFFFSENFFVNRGSTVFNYSDVPQTTLPAISVEKYLLLKSSLKILHLSPTFHFYNAMLQILLTTQTYIHYIHDSFTFMQKIPLNGELPPYSLLNILHFSERMFYLHFSS